MSNKYVVFVTTLLGYSTLHIMRMTLPFVQLDLMQFFFINKLEIGIANACLYIIIGLSYLWRALKPVKAPQFTYFWSMNLTSLFYLLTPLIIFMNIRIHVLFYISLVGFGLFQSAAWPVLLQIIHYYFKPRRDGCMLGFWSANGDIGNILGFVMCTVIAYFWKWPWQICLLVAGLTGIIMSFAINQLKLQNSEPDPNIREIQEEGYTQKILHAYKQILKDGQIALMILTLCILKATLYGILLWLPMYFEQSGFKQFQGYIPITMNIMAITGSVILGTIYEKVASKAFRTTIYMSTLIVTVICFYVVRSVQFTFENKFVLQMLIGIIGFCVMGNFNILSAHEVSVSAYKKKIHIAAFSSFVMAAGNILVGILQFIIGKVSTDDINSVFLIFFITSILVVFLQIIRSALMWKHRLAHQQDQNYTSDEQGDENRNNVQAIEYEKMDMNEKDQNRLKN